MQLVGVQLVNFTGRDGGIVSGVKFHCIEGDISPDKGSGQSVYSVFLSPEKCPKIPAIGSTVEFIYNRFGRVDRVNVMS